MVNLVPTPSRDESASHIAARMPIGMVAAGSTPISGPAISCAVTTPSAQPHGTAAMIAAAVTALAGMPTYRLRRCAINHLPYGPDTKKSAPSSGELIRDGYREV